MITLTDRIDYLAPLSNNLCYCLAAEKLIGLEVPKRAQYIRVLLTELTRITSHLVWLGTHAIDLGAMSVFLYSFREREEIMKIYEYVSGQRMMTSYFRIGGLALEPPPGWLDQRSTRRRFPACPHRRIRGPAHQQPHLAGRTQGVGVMSAADAIAMGASGPMLRGSGVAYDTRKAFPTPVTTSSISTCRRRPRAIVTRDISARRRNSREHQDRQAGHGEDPVATARSAPKRRESFRRRARR